VSPAEWMAAVVARGRGRVAAVGRGGLGGGAAAAAVLGVFFIFGSLVFSGVVSVHGVCNGDSGGGIRNVHGVKLFDAVRGAAG